MNPPTASDRIAYSESFQENVQGRLVARFRPDPDGEPTYTIYRDVDRRARHYTIDLRLETKRAQEIGSVSYFMDDPSYYNPRGSSEDADNQFQEEIESYGDVEIEVTVEMRGGEKYKQRAWLSNMLENGYAKGKTAAIRDAIERIKAN